MKIRIIGITEHKILIALQRLLSAFNRNSKIVLDSCDYLIYFAIIYYNNKIKVVGRCNSIIIEDEVVFDNDNIEYDKKYLILTVYYQILSKLTNKTLSYGVLTGIRPTKLVHKYKETMKDDEVKKILKKKYLISENKTQILLDVVNNQLKLIPNFNYIKKEVSIYINIPFCLSRCVYCSFTSYPSDYQRVTRMEYLNTLSKEIEIIGQYLKENKIPITTIYVGGGTPTALDNGEFEILLNRIKDHLLYNPVKEYTVECGRPDSLNEVKLKLLKDSFVTRISINPQTFNDDTLKAMNRSHSAFDIINIYNRAKVIGLNNINMDLIIGLPNENLKDYQHSLDNVLKLKPEAITIHYLAQKRYSDLHGENLDYDNDDYFKFYQYALNRLKENDYIPYYLYRQKNISGNLDNIGYAKRGYESLYNILMIEEAQTIIGLGCSASTKFLNHELILNPKDLNSYMNSYEAYLQKKLNGLLEMRKDDE